MNRKEKTQQNRFDKKIAPLLEELSALCEKFGMPMVTSVQVFENEENGARVSTLVAHPQDMSLPMSLSTSLMNGTTRVRIGENNTIQLIVPKKEMPENLKSYARDAVPRDFDLQDDGLEPLVEHAQHCEDCRILMEEAIENGENIDNIVVPRHEDDGLVSLMRELRKAKIPFIMPKNNIIH